MLAGLIPDYCDNIKMIFIGVKALLLQYPAVYVGLRRAAYATLFRFVDSFPGLPFHRFPPCLNLDETQIGTIPADDVDFLVHGTPVPLEDLKALRTQHPAGDFLTFATKSLAPYVLIFAIHKRNFGL